MFQILDIRNQFLSKEVYEIYAPCMYQPTWEKFCKKTEKLLQNNQISLLGAVENSAVVGIIVLETQENDNTEIVGIAVDPAHRQRGIGRDMVLFALESPGVQQLYAETDDDAVTFYRRCGFSVEAYVEQYPDGEVTRYQCVLTSK